MATTRLISKPTARAGGRKARVRRRIPLDDDGLTTAQLRELRPRMADLENPVRYLIEGGFGPRFALYYKVTDDVYALNDPAHATLFKRRNAALAVQKLLGPGTRIIRCTTRRQKGRLIPVLTSSKRRTKRRIKLGRT